jgi:hypothetical protein
MTDAIVTQTETTVTTTVEKVTAAHTVTEHLTLAYAYPAHEARRSDPHNAVFAATKKRLRALGHWQCWINNADCGGGPLECHHSLVEMSLAQIVDEAHFRQLYPEFNLGQSDEDFLNWIQSEGNMTILCPMHHRGILGIHTIHYSAWIVQRFMKEGVTDPEQAVRTAHP